jgi:hypothetical protein
MKAYKKMKYLLLVYCLFLTSCIDNTEKLKSLICNDSIQYWDYNMIRGKQNIWFTFSFDKNGNVIKYSFNKKSNKRWIFTDYGYDSKFKWSVTSDSIFEFMGDKKKILRYTKDTIYTISLKDQDKSYYVRVKGDLNIQKE